MPAEDRLTPPVHRSVWKLVRGLAIGQAVGILLRLLLEEALKAAGEHGWGPFN